RRPGPARSVLGSSWSVLHDGQRTMMNGSCHGQTQGKARDVDGVGARIQGCVPCVQGLRLGPVVRGDGPVGEAAADAVGFAVRAVGRLIDGHGRDHGKFLVRFSRAMATSRPRTSTQVMSCESKVSGTPTSAIKAERRRRTWCRASAVAFISS